MSYLIRDNSAISDRIIETLPIGASDSDILVNLIQQDLASHQKEYMQQGEDYYIGKHDILDREITYFVDHVATVDESASNNKLVHAYHKLLVEQKASYVAGKPITVECEDEDQQEATTEALGVKLHDTINDWIIGTSNKGVEWLHAYVKEDGEFGYIVIDAREVIPIWETQYEEQLISLVRYYNITTVDDKGEEEEVFRVEWWTSEDVTFFIQKNSTDLNGQGTVTTYEFDTSIEVNPRPHMFVANDGVVIGDKSWGRVPFIPLYNNSKHVTDLQPIKALIDDYDLITSDFSNTITDIQDVIWELIGYGGTKKAEFVQDVKTYKVIMLNPGEGSGARPITIEFPFQGRDSHLDRVDDDIFVFGMGVDTKTDKFGNSASGVALEFLYSLLDLKANSLIRKLMVSLEELSWFVTEYLDFSGGGKYDYKALSYTINKTMIMNEAEQIASVEKSFGVISRKTSISNHPWVEDLNAEEQRIAEEEFATPTVDLGADIDTDNVVPIDGDIATAEVQKDTSFNGAQIASAISIVASFKDGSLTFEAAKAMLMQFLKIEESQAKVMLSK